MKSARLSLFAAITICSLHSASTQAAENCSSIQARCAIEVGGTCNAATGEINYASPNQPPHLSQNAIGRFNACISQRQKTTGSDSAGQPAKQPTTKSNTVENRETATPVKPAKTAASPSGIEIPTTISCGPFSSDPANWPPFKHTITFDYKDRTLAAERAVTSRGRGKETFFGRVNSQGEFSITGHGERFNRKGGWVLQFQGRYETSGQTILPGSLVAQNGGRRNCQLALDLPAETLKARLALAPASATSTPSPVGRPETPAPAALAAESPAAKAEFERQLSQAVEAKNQAERNSKQFRDAAETAMKLAEIALLAKADSERRASAALEQAKEATLKNEADASAKVAAAEEARKAAERAAADERQKQIASEAARQKADMAARDERLRADRLAALIYTRPSAPITSSEPTLEVRPRPQPDPRVQALKNRFAGAIGDDTASRLFEGDPNDTIILLNESAAPHAIRVLSGEIQFQKNAADSCRLGQPEYGSTLDEYLQREFRKAFPTIALTSSQISGRLCDGTQADLLLVRRGAIERSERLGLSAVDAIARKQLSILMVVPNAPFELLRKSTASLQKNNTSQVLDGTLDGFGSIVIPTGDRSVTCVSSAEDSDFITRVLSDMRSATIFETRWPQKPTIIAASPDDLFVASKRGKCGFISGDAGLLQQLLKGLKRDFVAKESEAPFVSSVFLLRQEAEATASAVAQHRRLIAAQADQDAREQAKLAEEARRSTEQREIDELRRLQIVKTQDATQRALEETKRKNDELARIEEIKRQRAQVGSRGRTIMDGLEIRLKKHVGSVNNEIVDLRRRASLGDVPSKEEIQKLRLKLRAERVDQDFPAWANWLMDRIKEGWEFSEPVLALEDYGMSKWRGRNIEAISVRVEFPMLNRGIGERQRSCTNFVWINDEEFSFYREPKAYQCDSYKAAFQSWSTANQFETRWNVKLQ